MVESTRSFNVLPPQSRGMYSVLLDFSSTFLTPQGVVAGLIVNTLFGQALMIYGFLMLAGLIVILERTRHKIPKKIKLKVYSLSLTLFGFAMGVPAFAFTPPAACAGGVFATIMGPLISIAAAAGLVDITADACNVNLAATVVVGILGMGAFLYGLFKGGKDGDFMQGFIWFALILVAVIGCAVIGKVLFAGFTGAGGGEGG